MSEIYNIAHDISNGLKLEYQSGTVWEIQINCADDKIIMVNTHVI